MRMLYPNPGQDRTWTREKWKKIDAYCREIDRIIVPVTERITERALREVILFGHSEIRLEEGDLCS
jgi:hypothetical protein